MTGKKNQLELRYPNSVQGPFFKTELLTVPSLLNSCICENWLFSDWCPSYLSASCLLPISWWHHSKLLVVRGNIPQGEFSLSRIEVTGFLAQEDSVPKASSLFSLLCRFRNCAGLADSLRAKQSQVELHWVWKCLPSSTAATFTASSFLCSGFDSTQPTHPLPTFTVEGWRATAVIGWARSRTDGAEFIYTGRKPA